MAKDSTFIIYYPNKTERQRQKERREERQRHREKDSDRETEIAFMLLCYLTVVKKSPSKFIIY